MARDLNAEPLFVSEDIQGDILLGLPKKHERMLFFAIDDPQAFREFVRGLELTSQQECLAQRDLIEQRKAAGIKTLVPTPGLNVAFTFSGLDKLAVAGLHSAPDIDAFRDGMAARTDNGQLSDPPPDDWPILGPNTPVDGVFLLTGASRAEIANTIALQLAPVPGNGWQILHEERGQVRPDPVEGHEHFGYADGVSQPGVRGRLADDRALTPNSTLGDDDQGVAGQDLLWPGEFLFGYSAQNGEASSVTVEGDVRQPPIAFMKDGAYLVFRRLSQLVPEFDQAVKDQAKLTGAGSDEASAALLGAQMVGRWKSGAALLNAPTADDPQFAEGTPLVNDFEFGEDREGLICPWAAHVRKVYPRDDVPGNTSPTLTPEEIDAAEASTQTHRMMRRGIAFGPELTVKEAKAGVSDGAHARGLLFKCYVTSLESQFEFVQEQWVNSEDFSQPGAGIDPIIGQSPVDPAPFLGAAPNSEDTTRKPQLTIGRFVTMEGGEYFFAPSIPAIKGL